MGWEHALAAGWVAFLWWFSTGAILHLDRLEPRTYPLSLAGATALLAAGLAGILATKDATTAAGAYGAFASALLVWSWAEVSFLLGYVTGPRRQRQSAPGWGRLRQAVATILWHELATLALLAVVVALTRGAANELAWQTFALLWALRASAKLNLFLGVRNTGEAMLPPHLGYLASYFPSRACNALLPVSMVAMVATAVAAAGAAADPLGRPHEALAHTMVATLLALAALEHAFMVLPFDAERLFAWARPTSPRP